MPSHYIMVCILFAQDFSYEEFTDKQYKKKKKKCKFDTFFIRVWSYYILVSVLHDQALTMG